LLFFSSHLSSLLLLLLLLISLNIVIQKLTDCLIALFSLEPNCHTSTFSCPPPPAFVQITCRRSDRHHDWTFVYLLLHIGHCFVAWLENSSSNNNNNSTSSTFKAQIFTATQHCPQ
ncbi:hypothetical protein T06_2949, partial [Trichinella sp. T6]